MLSLPLQLRLTCLYVALSAVVWAICAATVYVLLENHLRTATDADLLEELNELALEVRLAERRDVPVRLRGAVSACTASTACGWTG